jgi:dTDP-4-dehydrorhamnose reductase
LSAAPKLLIVGASGFIGSQLMKAWPAGDCIGTFFNRPVENGIRFDIARERLADRLLRRGHHFTHAVLAQGVTKLDQCALTPDLSAEANVLGAMRAIDDLLEAGVHSIFLSSDAVFDGTPGPRSEEEAPCPILSYGRQKVAVEEYLQAKAGPWTILRLCKVVASFVDERNLLSVWLEKVARTDPILCATDQVLTPLDVDDVVRALAFFIRSSSPGLYHVAGSEIITRHGLLMELLKQVPANQRQGAIVNTCRLRDVSSLEPLPLDCSLKNDKLKALCGFEPNTMETVCSKLCSSAFFPNGSSAQAKQNLSGEAQSRGSIEKDFAL